MTEKYSIGFIGFGNMGEAMAKGLLAKGSVQGEQVYACARNLDRLQARCHALGVQACASPQEVVKAADVIVLAVKPHQLAQVVAPLREVLREKIVLSIAAGMPFAAMETLLAEGTAHLSMIPNMPIAIGEGVIVCEQTHSLTPEQTACVEALFSPCAQLVFVESAQLSIAGTLAGCGPAFLFVLIEALGDAGVKYGLSRAQAYTLAAAMVKGSGALQLASNQHPGALKDAVCSPKGTTIQGISALEEAGFRSALIRCIDAIEGSR